MAHSSNHRQITGDFAEHLILYWLSKNGFECVHVRHVGIDLIASKDGKTIGISVKGRSRKEGESDWGLTITDPKNHIEKIKESCKHFSCEGYVALVIDQMGVISGILTPLEAVEDRYVTSSKSSQDWNLRKLEEDSRTIRFKLNWQ